MQNARFIWLAKMSSNESPPGCGCDAASAFCSGCMCTCLLLTSGSDLLAVDVLRMSGAILTALRFNLVLQGRVSL